MKLNMRIDFLTKERLLHSAKTATACMLGVLVAKMINLPGDEWIVITIAVVMCSQINVGSLLDKAYLRFLGTSLGCIFAAVSVIISKGSHVAIAITFGLSSFLFSYLAVYKERITYVGTLGVITTAAVMVSHHPTIFLAFQRFIEISIGIGIATFISQYFFPISATTLLRREQVNTLRQMHNYYLATMITNRHENKLNIKYREMDDKIVQSLVKQGLLAKDSIKEPVIQTHFDTKHFLKTLYQERKLLRSITFMHCAQLHLTAKPMNLFIYSIVLNIFHENILQAIDSVMKIIETNFQSRETIFIPTIDDLKEEIENALISANQQESIALQGFLFCAQELVESLDTLATLYQIPTTVRSAVLHAEEA